MNRWLAAVLAAGAALRFLGLGYGLPFVFNADEPHVVNVAVSFGGGTLNPRFFKYPTLWMYLLFAAYGAWFAGWSGLGILRSVQQFGEMFAWEPGGFYLIGRAMSAGLSLAALHRLWRTGGLLLGGEGGLWAAALLAVSPTLVVAAHASKPESLMFFLACWSWWFAARHAVGGGKDDGAGEPAAGGASGAARPPSRDLVLCGWFAGLAASAQYTALPLVSVVLAAWWVRRTSWGALAAALGVSAGGFLIGSPFILLDFPAFRRTLDDMRALESAMAAPRATWQVVASNLVTYAGPWSAAIAATIAGAGWLLWRRRGLAALLLAPVALYAGLLSLSVEGSWPRYLFAAYPALALVGAAGVELALGWSAARAGGSAAAWLKAASLAALMVPGGLVSAGYVRDWLLPDTRAEAARWLLDNVPPGTSLLMDQEHASPRVPLSLEMVERLLKKTEEARHPKRKYYELMRAGHPGGGYEVYRVLRDPADLRTWPGHAAFSAQGHAVVDVRPGLKAAREAGIQMVVLTSFGADPARSPELAPFFEEVRREGRLLAGFSPAPGQRSGPVIEIYRLP